MPDVVRVCDCPGRTQRDGGCSGMRRAHFGAIISQKKQNVFKPSGKIPVVFLCMIHAQFAKTPAKSRLFVYKKILKNLS
jgi:hypothetical protein